ncbi:MAG: hypothetical protein HQL79_10085, partial [Magnetococcales bacterium]|nr:hypothetical protein [Magnetococcales bacterium]
MASVKESKPKAAKGGKKAAGAEAKKNAALEKVEVTESLKDIEPSAMQPPEEELPKDGVAAPSMEEVLNSLEDMLDGEALEEDGSSSIPAARSPKTIKLDQVMPSPAQKGDALPAEPEGGAGGEEDEILDLSGMEIDFPTPVDVAAVTAGMKDGDVASALEAELSSLEDTLGDEELPALEDSGELSSLEETLVDEEHPSLEESGELSSLEESLDDEELPALEESEELSSLEESMGEEEAFDEEGSSLDVEEDAELPGLEEEEDFSLLEEVELEEEASFAPEPDDEVVADALEESLKEGEGAEKSSATAEETQEDVASIPGKGADDLEESSSSLEAEGSLEELVPDDEESLSLEGQEESEEEELLSVLETGEEELAALLGESGEVPQPEKALPSDEKVASAEEDLAASEIEPEESELAEEESELAEEESELAEEESEL